MLKLQEGLNDVGNGTVRSVTLHAIQKLFLPKPLVKYSKFKVGHLTVTLRSCGAAPYVGKAKTKFRARFNNYKSAHRPYRKKNGKVSQQRFHEHFTGS